MREHVRVLQARHHAGAVCGRSRRRERARDEHEHEDEEAADAREHRHRPGHELARAPVEPDGERGVAGEDEEPKEQRALLPAPETCEAVAEGQRAARVLRDVDEREVATRERDPQHCRGDRRRAERGDQRVLCGERKPAAALPRRERARDERIRDEPEAQEERCASERGHYVEAFVFAGAYFDGHFVESVSRFATKVPFRSVPSTTTSRPTRNRSGTVPLYTTDTCVLL